MSQYSKVVAMLHTYNTLRQEQWVVIWHTCAFVDVQSLLQTTKSVIDVSRTVKKAKSSKIV